MFNYILSTSADVYISTVVQVCDCHTNVNVKCDYLNFNISHLSLATGFQNYGWPALQNVSYAY